MILQYIRMVSVALYGGYIYQTIQIVLFFVRRNARCLMNNVLTLFMVTHRQASIIAQ